MTEDKNFVKNELCLRLFSSRRQPPLLVPHCLGRSVSRLILLKSKIVYTNNITKCGVYWEFLHLCHKLVLLVHICDPAFRRTKKTHVHPRTSHVHPRASHVHPRASHVHPRASHLHLTCIHMHLTCIHVHLTCIQPR